VTRREEIRMTDAEIRAFLAAHKTIILSSIGPDGVPHPMPMWFVADDDLVVSMATFRGTQKIKNLQRDPRVSLLVESGRSYAELKGVVIYGRAELSEDTDAIIATLEAASRKETPAASRSEASAASRDEAPDLDAADRAADAGMRKSAAKRILIRVAPQRIISWDHSKLHGRY
jgi:PPOX class probable F420-dependent enzyme